MTAQSPSRWLAVLAFSALALGPLVYLALPSEISRWYLAYGAELSLRGDHVGAVAAAKRAAEWNPRDPAIYLTSGEWRLAAEQPEAALQEAEQALEFAPDSRAVRRFHALVLQHLARWEEAAEEYRRVYESWLPPGATTPPRAALSDLNGWAYARALAGTDLDSALADINQVIERSTPLDGGPADAAFLDTRGFLHHQLGDPAAALDDLDPAVLQAEAEYRRIRLEIKRNRHVRVDLRPLERFEELFRRNLAVIRYHRGLAHEARGAADLRDADYNRVRELGFDPGEALF